jgi:hypothetical protein
MNIIIMTHFNSQTGKVEANCHVDFVAEELTTPSVRRYIKI